MKQLKIKGTSRTPEVDFNTNGNLKISGVSIPDEIDNLYGVAKSWLREFIRTKPKKITFTFDFDYYNTFTQRYIYSVIEILSTFKKVEIFWLHDEYDEDLEEMGELFQDTYDKLNFKIKKR